MVQLPLHLSTAQIELQPAAVPVAPLMQTASLHTLTFESSRKVESASLLTNMQQKQCWAFVSGSNDFSGYRGWAPSLTPSAETDETRRAQLLKPLRPLAHQIYSTRKNHFGSYPCFWQALCSPRTCQAYLACATQAVWTDNPINDRFIFGRNEAWGTLSEVKQFPQPGFVGCTPQELLLPSSSHGEYKSEIWEMS